jgi:hypothetical protein
MSDKIIFENSSTIYPELVAIEVLKLTSDDFSHYTSQLVFVVSEDFKQMLNFPTTVWETTAEEACRVTLKSIMHIFESISSRVAVIDVDSHDIIETFNLDEMYPNWQDVDQPIEKIPENRVLH